MFFSLNYNFRWKGFVTGPSMALLPAGLTLFPYAFLAETLEYMLRANPQGLFPYSATLLYLTKTPRSSYENTRVKQWK